METNTLIVVGVLVVGFVGAFVLYLKDRKIDKLVDALLKTIEDKRVKDEAERLYLENSLTVAKFVDLLHGVTGVFGSSNPVVGRIDEFLDGITDGLPNEG